MRIKEWKATLPLKPSNEYLYFQSNEIKSMENFVKFGFQEYRWLYGRIWLTETGISRLFVPQSFQQTPFLNILRRIASYSCTALHCTALHCTAQHCPAQHCTALHFITLYCKLHYVAQLPSAIYSTTPHTAECREKTLYGQVRTQSGQLDCGLPPTEWWTIHQPKDQPGQS